MIRNGRDVSEPAERMPDEPGEGMDPARRAALRALAKYSGAVGAAATFTVLSADDAVANQHCSSMNKVCDNTNVNKSGQRSLLPETQSNAQPDYQMFESPGGSTETANPDIFN